MPKDEKEFWGSYLVGDNKEEGQITKAYKKAWTCTPWRDLLYIELPPVDNDKCWKMSLTQKWLSYWVICLMKESLISINNSRRDKVIHTPELIVIIISILSLNQQ